MVKMPDLRLFAVRWAIGAWLIGAACFDLQYHHPRCSPEGECPGGYACVAGLCESVSGGPDGIVETHRFGLPELQAGQRTDMTVEAWRGDPAQTVCTPNAYTYGGLVGHGRAGTKLWTATDTDWGKLATLVQPIPPATSGAGLWAGEEIRSGAGEIKTDYLGVSNDTTMTLWFEGEVWLDAALTETFRVSGDDVAFLDYAQPGSTTFTRVAQNSTGTIQTTTAGWYPIRIGFANGDGTYDFLVTHSDDGGPQVLWTRDRMRARTSELNGALRVVFGHQILGGGQNGMPPVLHFEQSDLLRATSFSPPPQGAGNDDWSAHYSGQVYVAQGGDYTLQITSDDGNRGRLGTTTDQLAWSRDIGIGPQPVVKQYPATLAAGWNELAVDYNQVAGIARLHVQMAGPDFSGLVDVPGARLRPVEPGDDRLVLGADAANHTVVDGGGAGNPATATMTVRGYPGETVTAIELTYQATSPRWGDLKLDFETPGGTRINLPDPGVLGSGDRVLQVTIAGQSAVLRGPANGNWKLHLYDVVPNGGSSTLESAQLTLHTQGGPDRIARSAAWTSAPLDATTSVIAIDGITWAERVPVGASVAVRFRTCADAACSEAPAWSDPVASGAGAAVRPARYLQLRVEMTSNGTLEPELRTLAVAYRRIAN
jgi:subtilisin-like proprotein convertase family protein